MAALIYLGGVMLLGTSPLCWSLAIGRRSLKANQALSPVPGWGERHTQGCKMLWVRMQNKELGAHT